MTAEKKRARWKVVTAYVAFAVASLVFGLFATFPYETLRRRLEIEADAAGLSLTVDRMGPGLLGVSARGISIASKTAAPGEPAPEALLIPALTIRPSLLPPGVAVSANLLGGKASAVVGGFGAVNVDVALAGLKLDQGNLKGFTGVDMVGELSGRARITMPMSGARAGAEPDLSQASGSVTADLREFSVRGGQVRVVVPMYGPEPTPVDLPKATLGTYGARIKIDKGTATVESFTGSGPGLELSASGTLKLARRLAYSEPDLDLKVRAEPEFLNSIPLYGAALSFELSRWATDPQNPKVHTRKLVGSLSRPLLR